MKAVRQLAAVLLAVAVIVVLAVAWEHSSEADWIAAPTAGSGGQGFVVKGAAVQAPVAKPPPGTRMPPAGQVIELHNGGAAFSLSNLGNLRRTAGIEAGIMAVVVVLDVARRRQRRARRPRG